MVYPSGHANRAYFRRLIDTMNNMGRFQSHIYGIRQYTHVDKGQRFTRFLVDRTFYKKANQLIRKMYTKHLRYNMDQTVDYHQSELLLVYFVLVMFCCLKLVRVIHNRDLH